MVVYCVNENDCHVHSKIVSSSAIYLFSIRNDIHED